MKADINRKASKKAAIVEKELIVTEKPSVAQDILAALGGKKAFKDHEGYFEGERYLVSWAVGHLLEFLAPEEIDPVLKRWRLSDLPIFPDPFALKPKKGQKGRLALLKKLMIRNDVISVINACDAGREGELIFREICRHLGNGKPIRRLWLQSMTPEAIREGFASLAAGSSFEGLGSAAECRAESDWLIGINATRALTKRLQTRSERAAWSVGRVQTPTLALLVERELEILSHQSRPYWRIKAVFEASDHSYEAWWFAADKKQAKEDEQARDDWIMDEEAARRIQESVRERTGTARETRKPSHEKPPPPFDLTTMQREANRKFGYSARRTLDAAQRLYESYKLITYPRTDSRCLPRDYEPRAMDMISKLSGTDDYGEPASMLLRNGIRNRERIFDDSGVTDHFAIMPIGLKPKRIREEDERIYDLVVRRFLSAFFPEALWENLERITQVQGENFRTRRRTLKEPGWRLAYEQKTESEDLLPPLQGASAGVETKEVEIVKEEAKPKPRISEAGLLRLMENAGKQIEDDELAALLRDKGLGTPATRAEIIENLIGKEYVKRGGKNLAATPKAIRLIDILKRIHVDQLRSAELTGELEQHLRQVERGERSREDFSNEIKQYTKEIVDKARDFQFDELYKDDPPLGPCPICRDRLVREAGFFYACQGVSDKKCDLRVWKEKQGRYLDRGTVEKLLRDGETQPVAGFFTRDGKPYSARLSLDKQGQVHVLTAREEGEISDPERVLNLSPIGPCPLCGGGEIVESYEGFVCSKRKEAGCHFQLPVRLCQRVITREEAAQYVAHGKTAILDGFISKRGRPFRASLVLGEKGKIAWEFPPRGNASDRPEKPDDGKIVDEQPLGSCPVCKKGQVLSAENSYVCHGGGATCSFRLPRVILGREMSREETAAYVQEGLTDILEGFVSRRNRPFRASLYLKKNGKHGFKFPPREG